MFYYALQACPIVSAKCTDVKFPDSRGRKGQRNTKVTDVCGIVEVVMLLPGRHAAQVRRQAAELLVRYLGGDVALVDEVCRNRGFQEALAVARPVDPRRVFGEAVEAASGSVSPVLTRSAMAMANAIEKVARAYLSSGVFP